MNFTGVALTKRQLGVPFHWGAREFKETKMNDTIELMDLIGATSAYDPKTLPHPCRKAVKELMSAFVFQLKSAEDRAAKGQEDYFSRSDAVSFALAIRVMLRPEVRDILIEESKKDD